MTILVCISSTVLQADEPRLVLATTPDGVRYGTWGHTTAKPAPTICILATTAESTLGDAYYRQCGNQLAAQGYLLVSIDLPCHGDQIVTGEPAGLSGWSDRAAKDIDFVNDSNVRLSKVLDHLIQTGQSDPERIAVGGTSRGGFLAIHFAAHDPRVKCAVGFAPVTDLAALSEFDASQSHPLVKNLSLLNQAEKLAGRPVWIIIGDRDDRVGTSHAIALATRLSAVARDRNVASRTELHVMSEPRGHTSPDGAAQMAAEWIQRQMTLP